MKPRNAKTEKQICSLKTDNYPARTDRWSISVGADTITLYPPVLDGNVAFPGTYIVIRKKQFNAIIDWYNKDQKP